SGSSLSVCEERQTERRPTGGGRARGFGDGGGARVHGSETEGRPPATTDRSTTARLRAPPSLSRINDRNRSRVGVLGGSLHVSSIRRVSGPVKIFDGGAATVSVTARADGRGSARCRPGLSASARC